MKETQCDGCGAWVVAELTFRHLCDKWKAHIGGRIYFYNKRRPIPNWTAKPLMKYIVKNLGQDAPAGWSKMAA